MTAADSVDQNYRSSSAWCLIPNSDGSLRISAGTDLTFDLEPMPEAANSIVSSWFTENSLSLPQNETIRELFDQFLTVGAIVPTLPTTPTEVSVRFLGAEWPELVASLEAISTDREFSITDTASLRVVVRTTASWNEVLSALPTFRTDPYLFLDVAYHHTASIGPYVVPNVTSCAGCLAGRLRERWGDPESPEKPAIQTHVALVAGLIGYALDQIALGVPTYVNATTSWDVHTGVARRENLYRVPSCPNCGEPSVAGRIPLPWAD